VNKFPVASLVRKQTGRPGYYVVAFKRVHVVEPDAARDESPDVGGVQPVRVVAPAREVAVLRRRQLGADAVDVEAPRAVPTGRIAAAVARRPRPHSSLVAEHLLVRLPTKTTAETGQSWTADFAPGFYTARRRPPANGNARHVVIAKNSVRPLS